MTERRLVGHSTDGDGFVASLAAAGLDISGCRIGIVGAGGASRSLVDALGRAGVADVLIVNRTADAAASAAALAAVARVGNADELVDVELVVNATSVGMGSAELPFDPALLRPEQVVVDLVYYPVRTALLQAADAAGCRTVDGLGMLVHQAVLQQELWTGHRPEPAVHARRRDRRAPPPPRIRGFERIRRVCRPGGVPKPSDAGQPAARSGRVRGLACAAVLRYLTAGESHGPALVVIVEGLPAGLDVTVDDVQGELARRRLGYGRGPRQRSRSTS